MTGILYLQHSLALDLVAWLSREGLFKRALGGKSARESLDSESRRVCACFVSLTHTCAARGTRCVRAMPAATIVALLSREGLSKGALGEKRCAQSRVASRGAPARGCSCVSRVVYTCARDSSSRSCCYWSEVSEWGSHHAHAGRATTLPVRRWLRQSGCRSSEGVSGGSLMRLSLNRARSLIRSLADGFRARRVANRPPKCHLAAPPRTRKAKTRCGARSAHRPTRTHNHRA